MLRRIDTTLLIHLFLIAGFNRSEIHRRPRSTGEDSRRLRARPAARHVQRRAGRAGQRYQPRRAQWPLYRHPHAR